jgi:hypothetical protein
MSYLVIVVRNAHREIADTMFFRYEVWPSEQTSDLFEGHLSTSFSSEANLFRGKV